MCTQSCPTFCNPMDCSLPASSVPGILQTRMLEWVAIPFSRDLPNPGIKPGSLALQADSSLSEALVSTSPSNKGWLPLTCCIFKGKGSWEFFVCLLVFLRFFFYVDIRPIFFKVFIEYVTILLLLCFGFSGCKAYGILAHWPGIEPTPPVLEGKVLASGLPGKSWPRELNSVWLLIDVLSVKSLFVISLPYQFADKNELCCSQGLQLSCL